MVMKMFHAEKRFQEDEGSFVMNDGKVDWDCGLRLWRRIECVEKVGWRCGW